MARPNKIIELKLEHIVARCISQGITASRQIASECEKDLRQRGIKEDISHSAVVRYMERAEGSASVMTAPPVEATRKPDKRREQAVKQSPERVQRLVDRDIDLIELQYQTTAALADRFQWIADLPDNFERRMSQLAELMRQEGTDTATLDAWGMGFALELRRNIGSMAVLNREIRQNLQFMAALREKAFEFKLFQEYLQLFMEIFREASPEAYEVAEQRIASNPRMQRITEQQQEMRGYKESS